MNYFIDYFFYSRHVRFHSSSLGYLASVPDTSDSVGHGLLMDGA